MKLYLKYDTNKLCKKIVQEQLDKYNLTKEDFDSAIAVYSSKPDVYQKVYEKVIELLTAEELAVKSLKDDKPEPVKKDSTRKVCKGCHELGHNKTSVQCILNINKNNKHVLQKLWLKQM